LGGGVWRSPLDSPLFTLVHFARKNRKAPTRSEAILWNALRDHRFRDIKFRRQHVLHPYIVDFFAPVLKLVVEVDGGYHRDRVEADAARDLDLAAYYGVRVVRIDANLVERDLQAALEILGSHIG
jgi:very-short-patch-repair endonuclease